jgi:hypothetical protein
MKSVVALLALVLLSATPAFSQNLLTNPSFNGNDTGWDGNGIFDSTRDDTGTAGSGSGQHTFVNPNPGTNTIVAMSQCIPITPGTFYEFGAKLLRPSGQVSADDGVVRLGFMSSTDCSVGSITSASESADVTPQNVWVDLEGGPIVAPPGAVRAWFSIQHAAGGNGTSIINVDDAFLRETEAVPVMPLPLVVALIIALMFVGWMTIARRVA